MKFKLMLWTGLAAALSVEVALAQSVIEQAKVVLADVKTYVAGYATLNPDCSPVGATTIRIRKQPRHGKVEVEEESGFVHYPPENVRAACNKRKVPMAKIFYTSDADYTGKDRVELEVFFPNGDARKLALTITVKK
jgi:hypothetical protein